MFQVSKYQWSWCLHPFWTFNFSSYSEEYYAPVLGGLGKRPRMEMWKLSKALRQEEVPPHSPCSESGGIYRSMGFPSEATDTALVTDAPSARSNHQHKQGWASDNMTSVNLVQLGCPLSFPGAPKTQWEGSSSRHSSPTERRTSLSSFLKTAST